mmetsp:Transcript_38872/g.60749  ORF Transcript_38872/g.60749 Transcript_38872/m.60749 type:complete len:500 (+) Transcript_38872:97-1596(+)
MALLPVLLLIAALMICLPSPLAHESCCKHKLQQQQPASEFIDDPSDYEPPPFFGGQPRFLVDPESTRPNDWDEEDDGPWEPNEIPNPAYEWKPRQIRNPNFQDHFQRSPIMFWNTLKTEISMAIPWVTLGVFVTGLATILLSLPYFRHLFGHWKKYSKMESNSVLASGRILIAALLGLATPLCSCGALPVALGFWNEGIPPSSVVAFLTASQSAGIDSAAITYGLLGPTAVLFRLTGALILAMAAGYCLPNQSLSTTKAPKQDSKEALPLKSGALRLLMETLVDTAFEVFPTLLLGLLLSSAIVHVLPSIMHPTISNESLDHPVASILTRWFILASALPLQLCEHTSVALAAAIQKAGGSPGLAFGFLLSAPATNLPTLLLLTKKMLATRNQPVLMLQMGVVISVTALAFSYIVDMLGMDLLVQEEANSASPEASLPNSYVSASPWLAALLLIAGAGRSLAGSRKSPGAADNGIKSDDKSCCNNTCSSSPGKNNKHKNK